MRNKIVGSATVKPNIKVNGTLELYVREKSLVGLRVGVDALEEATMIPQSSLWPSRYRLSHLDSFALLEELVVLFLSLMLIIRSEAQWNVLVETGPFYLRSSKSCSVRLSKPGCWKEISDWDLYFELYTLTRSVRCCSLGRSLIYFA